MIIALSKNRHAIIDLEDFKLVSKYKWHFTNHLNDKGYAAARNKHDGPYIYMHRLIMGVEANQSIDHINGNTLDNRKSNLRFCTQAQNVMNSRKIKSGTSKYKGVCWFKSRKKWYAKIGINYKTINLGLYTSEIEAAKAYDEAAKKYFGDFARLNFDKGFG